MIDRVFDPLAAAARDNPAALIMLAGAARQKGDIGRCLELARRAQALKPDDPDVAFAIGSLLARTVPDWHFPMLRDEVRNQHFRRAIERAVRPDTVVLDIGSGSGLLAMIAARAGAPTVHSCEANPVIAAVAERIVRDNGLAGQVTVHARNSRDIDPEADMGGRADLIIAEIIARDLVGEKVLPTMQDAARRLAKPGAQFIPRCGAIRVALAHHARMADRRIGEVCGFDLSAFNALGPVGLSVKADDPALTLEGPAASLFDFDFSSTGRPASRSAMALEASGGMVNGVAQWFRLDLDGTEIFESGPAPGSSRSWGMQFFAFADAIATRSGDKVTVVGDIANDHLVIRQG